MKMTLAMWILALGLAAPAFAHPTRSDLVDTIPEGSVLTFLQDVNVLPGEHSAVLTKGKDGKAKCYVEVTDTSGRDRVIRAGRTVVVTKGLMSWPRLVVQDTNKKIKAVYCPDEDKQYTMTIGEFLDNLEGAVRVEFSAPDEI